MRLLLFHALLLLATAVCSVGVRRNSTRWGVWLVTWVGVSLPLTVLSGGWALPEGPFAFSTMQLLCWWGFVHLPLALVCLALGAERAPRAVRATACVLALLGVGIGVDAFLIEPHSLVIRRVELPTPGVGRRIRVVVLSDVQTDAVGGYEREVFARARALRPDLVLYPGDYVQLRDGATYRRESAALARLIADLRPPLGAYAVRGNVEHDGWQTDVFAGTGVRTAEATTTFEAGPLTITALSFADSFDTDLVVPRAGPVHLVFGHGPDFARGRVDAELLVAGHTHGGQVQLPFFGPPLILSTVPRTWGRGGHVRLGRSHLVVSRGIGMERTTAPRLRFLCRPEIVVLDLVPPART